jgi:hypothetical protein
VDTFKDKQFLDEVHARGAAPWEVWKAGPKAGGGSAHPRGVAPGSRHDAHDGSPGFRTRFA